MGIGVSIFFLTVGAILKFAIEPDVLGQSVHPLAHRAAVAVDRRRSHTELDELVEIGLGDLADIEAVHPVSQFLRPDERDLHSDLLVKKHACEQGKRVLGQQLVGLRVTSETQLLRHGANRDTFRWLSPGNIQAGSDPAIAFVLWIEKS